MAPVPAKEPAVAQGIHATAVNGKFNHLVHQLMKFLPTVIMGNRNRNVRVLFECRNQVFPEIV